jgi:hypothetical protein
MSYYRNECPQLRHLWIEIQREIFGLVRAEILTMKMSVGKVRRSGVCYLMAKAGPVNENRSARSDTWGVVVVVVLLLVVAGLVRLILAA